MISKEAQPAFFEANRKRAAAVPPPRVTPTIEKPNRLVSGGIAMTPGGRLWATWLEHGESRFSHPVAAWSDDGGGSWSGPAFTVEMEVLPNGYRHTSLCSNFWCAPDGRLFWIFDRSMGIFDGLGGVWMSVCSNPDDASPVWGAPRRIWHGNAINKPIVRAGGEWLLGVSLWTFSNDDMFGAEFPCVVGHELDDQRRAHVFASRDGGETWEKRGGIRVEAWSFNEPNLMERRDGSLRMYLRSADGIVETDSFDGGRSWTPGRLSELRNPPARIFTTRLQSGAWLLVKHEVGPGEETRRQKLTAYLSDDEGKSWTDGLRLDDRYGVSYPDGFQAPDGRIFVCYDRMRTDGEFLLAVFREEDVRAGKPVSEAWSPARPIRRLPGFKDTTDESFVHVRLIANQ